MRVRRTRGGEGGLGVVLTWHNLVGVLAWRLGAVLTWRDPRTPLVVEHGEQHLPLQHVQEQSSTTQVRLVDGLATTLLLPQAM
jgi:hypothetical protein